MNQGSDLFGIGKDVSSPADFAGDVRSRVFRTQKEVADYLGVHPATISKYESGKVIPPVEYLAFLVRHVGDQQEYANLDDEALTIDQYRNGLVKAVNRLIASFRGSYAGVRAFRDWEHLSEVAGEFESKRRGRMQRQPPLPENEANEELDSVQQDAIFQDFGLLSDDPDMPGGAWVSAEWHGKGTVYTPFIGPVSATEAASRAPGSGEGQITTELPTEPLMRLDDDDDGTGTGRTYEATRYAFDPAASGHRLLDLLRQRRWTLIVSLAALLGISIAVAIALRSDHLTPKTPTPQATVAVANTPCAAAKATEPSSAQLQARVIEELCLDTRQAAASSTTYHVRSVKEIPAGQKIIVTVEGTFSAWSKESWASVCKGVPEAEPMYPTEWAGSDDINGPVGLDAEFAFAASSEGGPLCKRQDAPPYLTPTPLLFNLSNDDNWVESLPTSRSYSADHTYEYLLEGRGYPFQARVSDFDPTNNYGNLRINILLVDEPTTSEN